MKHADISQSILETIKAKKIVPRPRWTFIMRNNIIWFLSILSLLIGSAAASVIIFMVMNNDWGMYQEINDNFAAFTLLTLPYFWLVSLGLFVIVAYYNIRHTKTGYRYRLSIITLGSIGLSILIGALLYQAGAGEAIDEVLGARAPFYQQIINPRLKLWSQPSQGRLAGIIIKINGIDEFTLLDPREEAWLVYSQEAQMAPKILINIGEKVMVIGEENGDKVFKAFRIIQFSPPGKGYFNERLRVRQMHESCPDPIHACQKNLLMMPQP